MIPLDLRSLAGIVGGRLDAADADAVVTGSAQVDSRLVSAGDLFVAMAGENVDGHDYAEQAVRSGAVACLTDRPVGVPAVVVEDPAAALIALAAANARALPPTCVVIGLTGSSGKTSTKDLVAHLLESVGPTVAPPGSFNNEIGLPLTVLRADAGTRFLVLEMGARGVGHIAALCDVAHPVVGLVLNVGSAHVGEFGSADEIARAKGELVEALPEQGLAVLNADDPRVLAMAARTRARVLTFGTSDVADVRATDVELDDRARASFTLHVPRLDPTRIRLQLVGEHQVSNALAAAAVAVAGAVGSGADLQAVVAGLSSAQARSPMRMEVVDAPDGVTILNDAYNANPESVAAALRSLAALAAGQRSFVVLGEMRELGASSDQAHREVGRLARAAGAHRIVVVGEAAAGIVEGAREAGAGEGLAVQVGDVDAAIALLREELRPGDVVLVKASRAVGLERVVDGIVDGIAHGGAAR